MIYAKTGILNNRRYEKGTRTIPVEAVIKLADYYKVSTDYLLGRTDDPTPPKGK